MTRLLFILICSIVTFLDVYASDTDANASKARSFLDNRSKFSSIDTPSSLQPNTPRYDQSHQLMMGPNSIVHGCVNAITGSVFDSENRFRSARNRLKTRAFFCKSF